MKATEYFFPVVLFILLCKVVLTSESMDEIIKCDHSDESSSTVLSRGTVLQYFVNVNAIPFLSLFYMGTIDCQMKVRILTICSGSRPDVRCVGGDVILAPRIKVLF